MSSSSVTWQDHVWQFIPIITPWKTIPRDTTFLLMPPVYNDASLFHSEGKVSRNPNEAQSHFRVTGMGQKTHLSQQKNKYHWQVILLMFSVKNIEIWEDFLSFAFMYMRIARQALISLCLLILKHLIILTDSWSLQIIVCIPFSVKSMYRYALSSSSFFSLSVQNSFYFII